MLSATVRPARGGRERAVCWCRGLLLIDVMRRSACVGTQATHGGFVMHGDAQVVLGGSRLLVVMLAPPVLVVVCVGWSWGGA
jgi:hypothetical protein